MIARVYFDYKSPYSYLAMEKIYRIEADFGLQIQWCPWTLDVAKHYGEVKVRDQDEENEVKYLYVHARRIAGLRGLTLLGPKTIFSGEIAASGALFAIRHDGFRKYNDLTFKLFFERKLDIDQQSEVESVLKTVGIDPSEFGKFSVGEGKKELNRIRADAARDKVFGVPSLVLDGELFWGIDSLPFARQKLENSLRR